MKTYTNKLYGALLAINFALFINVAIGATPPDDHSKLPTCPGENVYNFIADQGYGRHVDPTHVPDPEILHRAQDLMQKALGNPGQGGLCNAKVYIIDKPFRLYRAYGKDYQKIGGWWGLSSPYVTTKFPEYYFSPEQDRPTGYLPKSFEGIGTKANYQANFGVCPSWNTLARVTSCPIKAGTLVVVGPGQSVDICDTDKDGNPVVAPQKPVAYPQNTTTIFNQVYVDNAPGYVFNPDGSKVLDPATGRQKMDPKLGEIQIDQCEDYYPGSNPANWK